MVPLYLVSPALAILLLNATCSMNSCLDKTSNTCWIQSHSDATSRERLWVGHILHTLPQGSRNPAKPTTINNISIGFPGLRTCRKLHASLWTNPSAPNGYVIPRSKKYGMLQYTCAYCHVSLWQHISHKGLLSMAWSAYRSLNDTSHCLIKQ